jgi:hypothetical protein
MTKFKLSNALKELIDTNIILLNVEEWIEQG